MREKKQSAFPMKILYRNTTIKFTPRVYEPAQDSFLLAEAALSIIKNSENILEVGCGSGIISAVIKKNTRAKITGIDINPYAAECTKDNGVEAIRGDLLNCIRGKFDIIIFNPPYLPTDDSERTTGWINIALDGGSDGRKIINRFLEDAGSNLLENGKILMLVSSLTGIEEVRSKMKSFGFQIEERNKERFSFEQLVVLVATKARK